MLKDGKAGLVDLHSETKLRCKVFQGNGLALLNVLHKLPHQALHNSERPAETRVNNKERMLQMSATTNKMNESKLYRSLEQP